MELALFKLLPDDIIDEIWFFLDDTVKLLLDKTNYAKYHDSLYNNMDLHNQYSYHRYMIQHDDSFIFNQILQTHGKLWIGKKKYIYKNDRHANYFYFIISLIQQYQSKKCNILLTNYVNEEEMCKNLYKKYRSYNIRWNI